MIEGVCKDCGNGTLNNDVVPAFYVGPEVNDDGQENGYWEASCLRCGSYHVDLYAVVS